MNHSLDYGNFIRQRRKEIGVSQQFLSSALGCTPQAISKYENNKTNIYLGLLGTFARTLKVDVTSFLKCRSEKNNDLADTNDFNPKAFRESLLFLREKNHLSQKVFSEKIDIPVFRITRWESGKALPTLEEFCKIADFYSISYDELYFAILPNQSNEERTAVEKKKKPSVYIILITIVAITLITTIILLAVLLPSTDSQKGSTSSSDYSTNLTSPDFSNTGRPPFIESIEIIPDK